ncbi:MAG: hypothetical protein Q8L56_01285 [Rhodocyclaceae bacterium]|nr:hypothetical protein [Rhodocyclaceae bacterium]
MNKQPIERARDADLRLSGVALRRAAQQARELARKTGTSVVVSRGGNVEYLKPEETIVGLSIQEPAAPYGGKE